MALQCVEFMRDWFNYENKEAAGYLRTSAARGSETTNAAVYTAVGLAFLADINADCDDNIFGGALKASSIISAVAFVEGVVNALLSPWFGSLVDAAADRRTFFLYTNSFWISIVVIQAFLVFGDSEAIFIIFAFSIIVIAVFYELALLLQTSYLPEVVRDERELTVVSSKSYAMVNTMQLLLVVIVTVISFLVDMTDLQLVQAGSAFTFAIWFFWMYTGYPLLHPRPAEEFKADKTVLGASRLKELILNTFEKYPEVAKYLVAYMFFFAGVSSVVALATQYLISELGYEGFDVQIVFGLALLAAIPGSLIAAAIQKRYNLKHTLLILISLWIVVGTLAPWVLVGQDSTTLKNDTDNDCPVKNGSNATLEFEREPKPGVYYLVLIFGIIWGIGIGSIFPISTGLYAYIIPGGDEAGYFGLKVFFSKLIVWGPPLSFTLINQAFGDLQFALLSIVPFFVVGFLIVLTIDMEKARRDISATMEMRRHNFEDAKALVASL